MVLGMRYKTETELDILDWLRIFAMLIVLIHHMAQRISLPVAAGIVVFCAIRDVRDMHMTKIAPNLFLILVAAAGLIIQKLVYTWCALTGMLIMNVAAEEPDDLKLKHGRWIRIVSKHSFSVYLIHLMMFDMATKLNPFEGIAKNVLWLVLVAMLIVVGVVIINWVTQVVLKMLRAFQPANSNS